MATIFRVLTPTILSDTVKDGIRHISVNPSEMVCSQQIDIELDGDTIRRVTFTGGCAGNTQGVASLVAGMKVDEACRRLEGIDCHGKGTSCPDQLAQALRYSLETIRL